MIPLVSLFSQSLIIFHFLLKITSTFFLSHWSLIRSSFFLAQDSKVHLEAKSPSFQDHGNKQVDSFDKNCSLSGKEVKIVMERLGFEKHELFSEGEERNKLDIGEISRVFEEEVRLEEVKEAFGVFDENKDGFIDAWELRKMLLALGFKEGVVELKDCENMIRVFDNNGDDKIDFQEFVKLFSF